jgi:enhancer of mRNA-decapping protein 4
MSIPGAGLLAALRRKASAPPEADAAAFGARGSAVAALEHAVAAGAGAPSPGLAAPAGRALDPAADAVLALDAAGPGEAQPELSASPVTRVATEAAEAHGRQVAASSEFIAYGLRAGHVRVLHRFSEGRALLKGHAAPVADLRFVGDGVLAAGGADGTVLAWRLRALDGEAAVHAELILSARFAPGCAAERVRLSAADADGAAAPSELFAALGAAAVALPLPPPGAPPVALELDPLAPAPPARAVAFPAADRASAVAASPDGALVAVGSRNGRLYVRPAAGGAGGEPGAGRQAAAEATPITDLAWLEAGPGGYALAVASADGAELVVYTAPAAAAPFSRGRALSLRLSAPGARPPFLHAAPVRPRALLLLADSRGGGVYALRWAGRAAGGGFDYLARFRLAAPALSFAPLWDPDAGEAGEVELSCVQAEAVQQYKLDPEACAPGVPGEAPAPAEAAPALKPAPAPLVVPEPPAPASPPMPSPELANGAPPAPPAPSPKLLTPTDLLRSVAPPAPAPARAESPAPAAAPQPSVRILPRAAKAAPAPKPAPTPAAAPAPFPAAPPAHAPAHAPAAGAALSSADAAGLLAAVRQELATHAAAQQAATAAFLREALAAQAAAVAAERAAVLAEERAAMERLLAAVSASMNRDLPARVAEAVRGELAAAAAAGGKDAAAAAKACVEKAVAAGVSKPLQESFKAAFAKQLMPAFEAAAGAMLRQVDATLAAGLAEHLAAQRAQLAEPAGLAAALRESLAAAAALSGGAGGGAPRGPPPPDAAAGARAKLGALLAAGRAEEAYARALGAQDVEMVVWLCGPGGGAAALAAEPPALSQGVLLSLVQQLASSDLAAGAAAKLDWLQTAALALNPRDPQIGPHLRPVLGQVLAALHAAAPRLAGADARAAKVVAAVVGGRMQ